MPTFQVRGPDELSTIHAMHDALFKRMPNRIKSLAKQAGAERRQKQREAFKATMTPKVQEPVRTFQQRRFNT